MSSASAAMLTRLTDRSALKPSAAGAVRSKTWPRTFTRIQRNHHQDNRGSGLALPISRIGARLPDLLHGLVRLPKVGDRDEIPADGPAGREPHVRRPERPGVGVGAVNPAQDENAADGGHDQLEDPDDLLPLVARVSLRHHFGLRTGIGSALHGDEQPMFHHVRGDSDDAERDLGVEHALGPARNVVGSLKANGLSGIANTGQG